MLILRNHLNFEASFIPDDLMGKSFPQPGTWNKLPDMEINSSKTNNEKLIIDGEYTFQMNPPDIYATYNQRLSLDKKKMLSFLRENRHNFFFYYNLFLLIGIDQH